MGVAEDVVLHLVPRSDAAPVCGVRGGEPAVTSPVPLRVPCAVTTPTAEALRQLAEEAAAAARNLSGRAHGPELPPPRDSPAERLAAALRATMALFHSLEPKMLALSELLRLEPELDAAGRAKADGACRCMGYALDRVSVQSQVLSQALSAASMGPAPGDFGFVEGAAPAVCGASRATPCGGTPAPGGEAPPPCAESAATRDAPAEGGCGSVSGQGCAQRSAQ